MDKVAVVTGGAQGLGAAAAKKLLSSEGFSGVMLVDRNAEGLAATALSLSELGTIKTCIADLSKDDAPGAVFEAFRKSFDRVDLLLNAAGNTERCGLDDTTPDSYRRLFDVNIKAPLFMMQEAARIMKKQRSGTIVNVASMLSYGGPPNLATYSASKGALVTLTRAVANDLKRDGVRVFCINLGWVATDGEHKLQTTFHKLPQDWAGIIGKRMPSGRLINAEDVAGLIAFLTTPPAQMMTGAIIDYEQMPVGTFDDHPALARE